MDLFIHLFIHSFFKLNRDNRHIFSAWNHKSFSFWQQKKYVYFRISFKHAIENTIAEMEVTSPMVQIMKTQQYEKDQLPSMLEMWGFQKRYCTVTNNIKVNRLFKLFLISFKPITCIVFFLYCLLWQIQHIHLHWLE